MMHRLVRRSHREGRPGSPRRRLVRRSAVVAALLALAVVGTSYVRALTTPGDASWTVKSVEWIRDNGGAGIVDAVENWWFRNPPADAPPSASDLPNLTAPSPRPGATQTGPGLGASSPAPPAPSTAPEAVTIPTGTRPIPGEGRWVAGRVDARGVPSMYTTFLQPDPAHASIVAGVAWIRAADTVAHLVAGTTQPGGPPWPGNARVTPGDVPRLVATFNSGWRFKDLLGGFYEDGRFSRPLQPGAGSVVIDRTGRAAIGAWGRDVSMSPSVLAVRQNLHLVVDGGAAAPGIADASGPWGVAANQRQYTWRSGLGVDAQGNLVYVAGNHMTLEVLVDALVDAHAVRAVELDMHPGMVAFSRWLPTPGGGMTAQNLLPTMPDATNRYLSPDQRDFFYITLR
ncbi:hypothetical protein [Terrabacter sp. NPDC080008]|uniref:hypothetical protein n=1 Tax=Terrabacter sp. NPDC080008 TaxID=3155176 RepID=UPI00344C5C2E